MDVHKAETASVVEPIGTTDNCLLWTEDETTRISILSLFIHGVVSVPSNWDGEEAYVFATPQRLDEHYARIKTEAERAKFNKRISKLARGG